MVYQTYSLTRVVDGDSSEYATSFTTSDDDAINCAHMLAAGFNTISRNLTGDFVLGVVDTRSGSVQYDGKTERFDRPAPEQMADDPWGTAQHRLSREVLEDAYAELEAVKEALQDAGVETIPADLGAKDLSAVIRARDAEIAELRQDHMNRDTEKAKYENSTYMPLTWGPLAKIDEALRSYDVTHNELDAGVHKLGQRMRDALAAADERNAQFETQSARRAHVEQQNSAARTELIAYVKGAYVKKERLTVDDIRHDLEDQFRGMRDVLARFLVAIGETTEDDAHAYVDRLIEGSDDER